MSDDSFRHRVQDGWGTACLICERSPSEWISSDNRRLVNSLHHINGDDTDDRVANVIPLCQRCHIHVHKTDAPPYWQWHRQLPIEHRHAWNAHHKVYYEGSPLNSVQAEWFFGGDEAHRRARDRMTSSRRHQMGPTRRLPPRVTRQQRRLAIVTPSR